MITALGPVATATAPDPPAWRPDRRGRFTVAWLTARKASRSAAVWGLVFGVYALLQVVAYAKAYPTQRSRDAMQHAYGNNVGLNALLGVASHINTVAGYASWRVVGALSIVGGVWGILTSTRLLRGEEDAGRLDMLVTGRTDPRHAGLQSLVGLGIGLGVLVLVTGAVMLPVGGSGSARFSLPASAYFTLVICAGAATFLAVGALASQLMPTRRQAATLSGAVLGVAYALRMLADSSGHLHFLLWASPLGWIEASSPLVRPDPVALLPLAALVMACLTLSAWLASRRDLGSGVLRDRASSSARLRLLSSPLGMAVRQARGSALAWLAGTAVFALLLGSVAVSSTKDAAGSKSVEEMIERLGGHGTLAEAYLGLTFLVVAFVVALVAVGQLGAARKEESDGHLELVVARPARRTVWLGGRLGLASALALAAGLLAGCAAWMGAAGQRGHVGLGSMVLAGLNVVPPSLFLIGLGALVFGLAPRWTSRVLYGYLTWSLLLVLTGGLVHLSRWVMDSSVFFHVAPVPATPANWTALGVLSALGVLGCVLGLAAFDRRDLAGE